MLAGVSSSPAPRIENEKARQTSPGLPTLLFVGTPAAAGTLPSCSICFSVNCPWPPRANALLFWLRLRHDRRCHRLLLERVLQNFVQRAHVGDLNIAENLRSEIRHDIRLVICRQEDFGDALPASLRALFPSRRRWAEPRPRASFRRSSPA